jgi:hypothetical protein
MKTAALSVRVRPSIKASVERRARREGRSVADVVERALREPCFDCGQLHIIPDDPDSYGTCHQPVTIAVTG